MRSSRRRLVGPGTGGSVMARRNLFRSVAVAIATILLPPTLVTAVAPLDKSRGQPFDDGTWFDDGTGWID